MIFSDVASAWMGREGEKEVGEALIEHLLGLRLLAPRVVRRALPLVFAVPSPLTLVALRFLDVQRLLVNEYHHDPSSSLFSLLPRSSLLPGKLLSQESDKTLCEGRLARGRQPTECDEGHRLCGGARGRLWKDEDDGAKRGGWVGGMSDCLEYVGKGKGSCMSE